MRDPLRWPRGPFGGLRAQRWDASDYFVDGIEPSLVLDFGAGVFASDPGGWAQVYAVDGTRPGLVLDFGKQEYGA